MITAVLLTTLAVCLVAMLFSSVQKRRYRQTIFERHGIPGPCPSLLSGNFHQIWEKENSNDVLSTWIKEYGNVFGYFIGDRPLLVINDTTLLKNILIKDFNLFVNRMPSFSQLKAIKQSLLGLSGDRWKEVRHVMTPTFSSGKIKIMFQIMNEKVSNAIEVVSKQAIRNDSFNIHDIMRRMTLDVIAESALAMKINSLKDPTDKLLLAGKKASDSLNHIIVYYIVAMPILADLFQFIYPYTSFGRTNDELVQHLESVIQYRRDHPSRRISDLLQLLLDSSESTTSNSSVGENEKEVQLTDDEIIANASVALMAGHETTSSALAYACYLLAQHPDVQEKLYQDIIAHVPVDKELSYEDIANLQCLDRVLNETLRLYPPVTGFVTRMCDQAYQIGRYTVPKGVGIQVPIWQIHHDPNIWPDPWKFDPERFSPENKAKIDKAAHLAFGIGPRNCIGMRFAQLEAKLAIARLVKKFMFVTCERTESPLNLICRSIAMIPKNGIFLRATLRK